MLYGNLIFIKKSGGDGSKFPVTVKDINIGRSENCLIRISNPQVALIHCQLLIKDNGQATLRNLSKKTILNGKPLGLEDVTLCHGDIFKLGERLARWEYLPASKYYTNVFSPTKHLVPVVMPQQRYFENTETSAAQVSGLKGTPLGKRTFSEKATLDSSSAAKNRKSGNANVTQKSKSHLSKSFTGCHSLKTTKLVLPGAKVNERKSLSGIVGLKVKENIENKSRRSTMPSWKVNILPADRKCTASRVSLKDSHQKLSKSPKSVVNTPSKNVITLNLSENLFSSSNCGIKTPQKPVVESEFSEEISTSKKTLRRITESSSKISEGFGKSTCSSKSPVPKKITLKTPSKLVLSTPKQKPYKKLADLIYSDSKLASFTKRRSLFPKGTREINLIIQKVDSNSWQNSNGKVIDKQEKSKDFKTGLYERVISNKILQSPLKNLDKGFLLEETEISSKALKSTPLKKTPEKLVKTQRRSLIKRSSRSPREVKVKTPRKSLIKKSSRSPREVKVKTPRKSLIKKTPKGQSQKQPKTPTGISSNVDLDISAQMTKMTNLDDLSNLKNERSVSVKSTPIKKIAKLVKSTEKTKTLTSVGGKRSTPVTQYLADETLMSFISPVKASTSKKSQKTESSTKKTEGLSKSRLTSTREVRRKLSPSSSAERAAKKLKTSCPKKPDKNKKAALLVLGIASRNQPLSQNVKVLLKKAIKQSNAASARKNDRRLKLATKLKKELRKKTSETKSKKNKSSEKVSPLKVKQTISESATELNKVVDGVQQSVSKVLQASVRTPKEKTMEVTNASPPKQSKKSESLRSVATNKCQTKTFDSFDKSAENYLFNTHRRCSKRLSSKHDTGRPDFIELSPTALGLIPKNMEVFKTPKDVKRRSSTLVTPKSIRTTGIIKSASTSKIGNLKSVRFSSKDLSLNAELGSPSIMERTDSDFSSLHTSDVTMDIFVSPLTDESSDFKKDLNESKVKFIMDEISKTVTKNRGSSNSKKFIRKLLQSPQSKKNIDKISSNHRVPRISTSTAISSLENFEKKSATSCGNNNSSDATSARQLLATCNLQKTPKKTKSPENDLTDVRGVKRLLKTPKQQKSPKNDLTDVRGVKRLLQTPKEQKSPENDLTDVRGVKRLLKTPKQQKSPKNDLTDVRGVKRLLQTPKEQKSPKNDLTDVRGVKRLLRTPKQQKSPKNDLTDVRGVKRLLQTPKEQKSPRNDLTDVRGVKKLLKTPKQQKSPKNDLRDVRGVKTLLKTPKQQKSPKNDLRDVRGVKRLLRTPKQQKSPKNDLTDVRGVKRLLQTPKEQKSPRNDLTDVRGVKRLLKTPKQEKSPKNDLTDVRGVKRLLKTPKQQKSPKNDLTDVRGVKRLLRTPKQQKSPKNDLRDVRGVKRLLRTPKQQKSPKNDLTDVRGVKRLLRTPKQQKSPKNDLTDVRGVKRLLRTPKQQKSPKNDLRDVRGVKRLLKTPKQQKSPKNDLTDVRGVKRLLRTPKQEKSPKNDLSDVSGIGPFFKSPDMQNRTKTTKELDKTPPNKILRNTVVNELLIPKSEKNFSINKKDVLRKLHVNDFRAIRGRRTIRSTRKSSKNDLSDLTGVRELFSRHKPINDLNIDLTGIAELFDLAIYKDVSKQRVVEPDLKSESSPVKSRTVITRSKKLLKAEEIEPKAVKRGLSKKAPEKETKRRRLKSEKLETSDESKTNLNEKKTVKRKASEKVKTSQAKRSSVALKEKPSEKKLKTPKEFKSSESSQKNTLSRKRKVETNDFEISPPKQRKKLTATEKSSSTGAVGISKKAASEVFKSRSKTASKGKISVKRSSKVFAKEKNKTRKESSKVQPKETSKNGTKKIQKVQNKRSQSSSKINASGSAFEVSPRKTRSTKAGTFARSVASRTQSKEVEKKVVKKTARMKKATSVVKKCTR